MFEAILTIAILRKKSQAALGMLALLALTGCTPLQLQPRPSTEPVASSPARCEAWNGAELLWPLVDSYVRGVLEQQRHAACSAPPAAPSSATPTLEAESSPACVCHP